VQWFSLGPGLLETWNHVSAAGYRHYLGGFHPSPDQQAALLSYVYPWLAAGLLALASWSSGRRGGSRGGRLALGAAALLQTAYAFGYGVADPAAYFLPPLALGLFVFPAAVAGAAPLRRLARPLIVAAALGLCAAAWPWSGTALEQRALYGKADEFLRTMWRAVPIRRGFVLWDDDQSYRLVQYQRLDHEQPGLVVVRPRLLMDSGARRLFALRHGFDPLGGAPPPDESEADSPGTIER
jgi:hypothetical protein